MQTLNKWFNLSGSQSSHLLDEGNLNEVSLYIYIYMAFSIAPGMSRQGNYFSLLAIVFNEMRFSGGKCDQNEYLIVICFQDRPSDILSGLGGGVVLLLALHWDSSCGQRSRRGSPGQSHFHRLWDTDQDQFLKSTWKNLLDQPPASTLSARPDRKFPEVHSFIHPLVLQAFLEHLLCARYRATNRPNHKQDTHTVSGLSQLDY